MYEGRERSNALICVPCLPRICPRTESWLVGGDLEVEAASPAMLPSSIYSRITIDSGIGFPLWTSTGTCLYTGLLCSRSSLLFFRSSSMYSYSIPLNFSAICTLTTYALAQKPRNFTSFPISPSLCRTPIVCTTCNFL